MRERYLEKLEQLHKELLEMGLLCEKAIMKTYRLLLSEEERQEFLRIAEKMLQNLDTFPANTVKKNTGRKKQYGGRTDE